MVSHALKLFLKIIIFFLVILFVAKFLRFDNLLNNFADKNIILNIAIKTAKKYWVKQNTSLMNQSKFISIFCLIF